MNKNFIGVVDRKGNPLYDGAKVTHRNIDGQFQTWIVGWSDYRKQWLGTNEDEVYDIGQELLSKSKLIDNNG